MKNAHPLEVAILIAVLTLEAAAILIRVALVPMVALVLTLAHWRPAAARTTTAEPAAAEPPLARPTAHPLALLAEQLTQLPVTQLRTLAGTRSKRIRKADLIAMVIACS